MAGLPHHLHEFPTRQDLAQALSDAITARLSAGIATRGEATIAVSGGTTPALLFETLSRADLDWSRVSVTLVDERFVEPSSPRSNEGLVRNKLLQGAAASARFVPLYRPAPDAPDALRHSEAELERLRWPADVVVLGMGTDGHTASFFPDAPSLPQLLQPGQGGLLRLVDSPSAGETRLTLSIDPITSARFLALHIEGPEKREVLRSVLEGRANPPIRAVIAHSATPVEIYWAP